MLTTTDPKEIAKYEAGIKWYYEQFKQQSESEYDKSITDRQWTCIYTIQKKRTFAPKFEGNTRRQASEYITQWGGQ